MSDLSHIRPAEPVIHGALKIIWDDGYEGVVDLRPVTSTARKSISDLTCCANEQQAEMHKLAA
jgi:hypothetical protein